MKFHEKEGTLCTGETYTLVGRPINGEAYDVDEHITVIGEDAAVVLPEYGIVGVFDGSGGTRDFGSPVEAAVTAARTVRDEYFAADAGNVSLGEVLCRADDAVIHNPEASVCVGALLRVHHNDTIEVANAGDTGIWVYDTRQPQEMTILAEQQIDRYVGYGDPLNFLGTFPPDGIRYLPTRYVENYTATLSCAWRSGADELYIGSDGVLGSWIWGYGLDGYDFQSAREEELLLRAAVQQDPELAPHIRELLAGEIGRRLRSEQLRGYDELISPELDDPTLFTGVNFDWSIWESVVGPYVSALNIPRQKLSRQAMLRSLINPVIRWPFESWKDADDATVVMITPPGYEV